MVDGGDLPKELGFSLPVATKLNFWTRERKYECRVQKGYKRTINTLFH